jgi:hypothetical protein
MEGCGILDFTLAMSSGAAIVSGTSMPTPTSDAYAPQQHTPMK